MKVLKPELGKIAIVSVVLFLSLFTGVLLFFGTPAETVIQSLLKTGGVFGAIGLFWAYFEKHGWRHSWLRLFGWLSDVPVLHGRWEGTICRDGDDQVGHSFVLEISQTFSSIKFRTFGEKATGESLSVAIIVKDDLHSMWEVNTIWRSEARKLDDPKNYEQFTGASTWKVAIEPVTKKLTITDRYFTSRRTSGTINVQWMSEDLLGKFQ